MAFLSSWIQIKYIKQVLDGQYQAGFSSMIQACSVELLSHRIGCSGTGYPTIHDSDKRIWKGDYIK